MIITKSHKSAVIFRLLMAFYYIFLFPFSFSYFHTRQRTSSEILFTDVITIHSSLYISPNLICLFYNFLSYNSICGKKCGKFFEHFFYKIIIFFKYFYIKRDPVSFYQDRISFINWYLFTRPLILQLLFQWKVLSCSCP